jgi:hypothetical protein
VFRSLSEKIDISDKNYIEGKPNGGKKALIIYPEEEFLVVYNGWF